MCEFWIVNCVLGTKLANISKALVVASYPIISSLSNDRSPCQASNKDCVIFHVLLCIVCVFPHVLPLCRIVATQGTLKTKFLCLTLHCVFPQILLLRRIITTQRTLKTMERAVLDIITGDQCDSYIDCKNKLIAKNLIAKKFLLQKNDWKKIDCKEILLQKIWLQKIISKMHRDTARLWLGCSLFTGKVV